MKGFIVLLAVLLAAAVIGLPYGSGKMIEQGFARPQEKWAAGAVFRGARIRMVLQQYASARAAMEKGMQVFPTYPDLSKAHYWVAVCYEKEGNSQSALAGFKSFLARWPNHQWADQARRHVATLEAGPM
jgi:TolA-binding protein